jgi:thiosulfate/3-mercaptopyruvate sulfurtransferase
VEVLILKNIVSAEWLLENINRDDLVILDCRFSLSDPSYGEEAYKKAHIKKAVLVDLEKDLAGEKGEHGGRHPLPDMNVFAKRMEDLGVSDESTVVIYDEGDIQSASRLWWMLKYIGKDNVYVLEGGIGLWSEKGFETTNVSTVPGHKGKLTVNIKPEMRCDVNFVSEQLGSENTVIIDSRSSERYLGLLEPVDKKAGHIPGAKNYFWQEILDGYNLKDMDKLSERFKDLEKYDKIIVHCGSGITACPNILVMDELGLKPIHYAGAWSDWISYDENPVISEK